MIIRNVDEADFEQIVCLFQEFAAFEKRPDRMTNSLERMQAEKEFFHCFVAETKERKLIGYVTYFFCYYTWTGKAIYLDDLYITLEYRNKGLGTSLINKVIDRAKETKCHKVRWQVSKWNKSAIDFYIKVGAKIDDTDQNCDLFI
jgi:GNAT superfamily N-acetyltransferase